jgi:hypothetical protein
MATATGTSVRLLCRGLPPNRVVYLLRFRPQRSPVWTHEDTSLPTATHDVATETIASHKLCCVCLHLSHHQRLMSAGSGRANDPVHFPNLHGTFVTLFRMATMEDWTDVMYVSMYGCQLYQFGNPEDQYKCENSEGASMIAALCTQ